VVGIIEPDGDEIADLADVDGQKVRLSANAAVAVTLEQEKSGKAT